MNNTSQMSLLCVCAQVSASLCFRTFGIGSGLPIINNAGAQWDQPDSARRVVMRGACECIRGGGGGERTSLCVFVHLLCSGGRENGMNNA